MYHLRYTPYDISGYTFDFLDKFDKYIVAYEDKKKDGTPTEPHYHIWIVTDYSRQTIVNDARVALKIPAGGKGKNNAYYACNENWKDPGYICKYDNIIKSKGYSDKQILEYAVSGKLKYLTKEKKVELSGEVAPATNLRKIPFQQYVINEAYADWINYKKDMFKETGSHEFVDKTKVVEFVCKAMREYNKGINPYLVKELSYAVLYDDIDFRHLILQKCKNTFLN